MLQARVEMLFSVVDPWNKTLHFFNRSDASSGGGNERLKALNQRI